jgi:hypothetical protein
MTHKKPADKEVDRSRLSQASRLLGGAVRASLQVPPPEEPWRNKKLKGNKSKKHR